MLHRYIKGEDGQFYELAGHHMKPDIEAVIVHYHSGADLPAALEALHTDWALAGLRGRVIIVDNGHTEAEHQWLRAQDAIHIDNGRNIGFAAAVNRGVAAGSAPIVVLLNPDAVIQPGCHHALLNVLNHDAAAAAPATYWDGNLHFLLPPTEPLSWSYQRHLEAAGRNTNSRQRARAIWRQNAYRHWTAKTPISSHTLCGAMLAFHRAIWDQVGPFDDSYFMYYEETDWLQRIKRRGHEACYVPDARCVHGVGRSTPDPQAAAAHLHQSRAHFYQRRFGHLAWRAIELLAQWTPHRSDEQVLPWNPQNEPLTRPLPQSLWIEFSPGFLGFPAVGYRWAAGAGDHWTLPQALWNQLLAGHYTCRLVTDDEQEHASYAFDRS